MTELRILRSIAVHASALTLLASPAAAQKSMQVNTLKELTVALTACWLSPAADRARTGMQITVRMSFKSNGELLGKPRITFELPGASDDQRLAYRIAVMEMIERCTPLHFTASFGQAVAGRPLVIRFIDDRQKQTPA